MDRWLTILGIVAPLLSAVSVAIWRRNDAALTEALKANAALKAAQIETRFEAVERRTEEHHMDCVERFERADGHMSKLASTVQGLMDLPRRVEALERGRR